MNPYELLKPDHAPSGVFVCGECNRTSWSKHGAEECCVPRTCKTCGQPSEMIKCHACFDKEEAAKERARFEKAEKLTTWDGWVYVDGYGYKNGYFQSLDDLLDYCADEEHPLPEYAWTCEEKQFVSVDPSEIYERIAESDNAYEDFEIDSLKGTEELERALDAFAEANKNTVSYFPDYSKAVLLQQAAGEGEK